MLLTWKDGVCQNPPQGWAITCWRSEYGDGWRFFASKNSGFGGIDDCGYPTERSAQLAVEAALLRLGVIPLPAWSILPKGLPFAAQAFVLSMPGWPTMARIWADGETWRWDTGEIDKGARCGSQTIAQAAAERHLRAELAAYLDELAAKDGVG